jgi:hypothetical protein
MGVFLVNLDRMGVIPKYPLPEHVWLTKLFFENSMSFVVSEVPKFDLNLLKVKLKSKLVTTILQFL